MFWLLYWNRLNSHGGVFTCKENQRVLELGRHGGMVLELGRHGGMVHELGRHGGMVLELGRHGGMALELGRHGGMVLELGPKKAAGKKFQIQNNLAPVFQCFVIDWNRFKERPKRTKTVIQIYTFICSKS